MQRTLPIKYGGLDNEPIITASDLDFSQDHGQIYIVSGSGGREYRNFTESKTDGHRLYMIKVLAIILL